MFLVLKHEEAPPLPAAWPPQIKVKNRKPWGRSSRAGCPGTEPASTEPEPWGREVPTVWSSRAFHFLFQ